jgi:hypothetical protein
LIIIENDDPLSTIKETIIALQAKHPNLDLTFQQTSQHLTQLKKKKKNVLKHPQPKRWTSTESKCILEIN